MTRTAIVLTILLAPAAIRAAELDLQLARRFDELTARLDGAVPADPAAISEAGLATILGDPDLARELGQRRLLSKVGVPAADAFALAGGEHREFLRWVLGNTSALDLALEGATPTGLEARERDDWAIGAGSLEIWRRIWLDDPESRDGLWLRLAIATALAPPGSGNRGAGMSKTPEDPVSRYRHFKAAWVGGELFPTFESLSVWELEKVVSSCASDGGLTWARRMLSTWRPDLRASGLVVNSTSEVWRRASPIPYTDYRSVIEGGGKCGPRSSWSVMICQAFGIPAIGVGQPGHACVAYKAIDPSSEPQPGSAWKVAYGRGWPFSRLEGLSGPDFLAGVEARSQADAFSRVEHLRGLAAALPPGERAAAVLRIAGEIARSAAAAPRTDLDASARAEEADREAETAAIPARSATEPANPIPVAPVGTRLEAGAFAAISGVLLLDSHGGGTQVNTQKNLERSWVDYRLDVAEAGTYGVAIRAATPNRDQVLEVRCGAAEPATIPVPNTTGLWGTTPEAKIALDRGVQTLRVSAPFQRGIAIRWLDLRRIAAPPDPAATRAVGLASLLAEMADRDAVARFPDPPYRSLQASSYNRASTNRRQPDQGVGGWFADSDGLGFIRTETVGGKEEWVLLDHRGPGCLTRIWTPSFYFGFGDRKGPNVRVYLDGEAVPAIDEGLIDLVTAKGTFGPPLATPTARAGDSYAPIPFARSCKVTMTARPFYYIVNYRAYPEGTRVETFTRARYEAAAGELERAARALTERPDPDRGEIRRSAAIPPGGRLEAALPPGPGALHQLSLRLPGAAGRPALLRSTVLAMTFDGEETVWCPAGDFFSSADSLHPFHTWQRTVAEDGWMVCRWTMPYRSSALVRLRNLADEPVEASLRADASPWDWDERSMRFHATWRPDDVVPGTPFRDWNFVDVSGRGVFVGDAWTVLNPQGSWWGEGDEKIWVDGAWEDGFPTHFGTGTEDYYGWAGGEVPTRRDEFSAPFLANVRVGGLDGFTTGFNICTRTRSLDAIPFERRLRFDMESSFGTDIRNPWNLLGYSAVAFWYAMPGAKHDRPAAPAEAARPILALADLRALAEEIRAEGSAAESDVAIVFVEPRERPIRRGHAPPPASPAGTRPALRAVARPAEFFVFQIGVQALKDCGPLAVSFEELAGSAGAIPATALRCLSIGGIDHLGRAFAKEVRVEPGVVQPLWVGIDVPREAKGAYAGTARVRVAIGAEVPVDIALEVEGPPADDAGDSVARNLSRLRWLDSTAGSEETLTHPFIAVETGDRWIRVLGRELRLGDDGLPARIASRFSPANTRILETAREVLARPAAFVVETSEGRASWESSFGELSRTELEATWTARSSADGLRLETSGRLDFTGSGQVRVRLLAGRDVELRDARLEVPFREDAARYFMGLNHQGGRRPPQVRWTWDPKRHQDCFWMGDVNAGLMLRFKDASFRRPAVNIYYAFRPLRMPESWGNEGRGGVEIAEARDGCVLVRAGGGPRSMKKGDLLDFIFDIYLTPFRTLDTEKQWAVRFIHVGGPGRGAVDDAVAGADPRRGPNVVNVHHASYYSPYINYPYADDSLPAFRELVRRAHEKGVKLRVYYTTREITQNMPELFPLHSLGGEVILPGPGREARTLLHPSGPHAWLSENLKEDFVPAWEAQVGAPYAELDLSVITTPDSRWNNFYLEGLRWLAETSDFDGMYVDDTALDATSLRRARRILDSRPGRLIDLHTWNHFNGWAGFANNLAIYMEILPYLDRLWLGEGFDANAAAQDFWLVEMSGLPFGLMSEMLDGANPWRGMVFGETARLPWSGDPRGLWNAWDELGIQGTEFLPWFLEDAPVRTGRTDVLATAYRGKGRTLIAIGSWAGEDARVRLEIDWEALGLDPSRTTLRAPAIAGMQDETSWNPGDTIPVAPGRGWFLVLGER